MRHHNANRKFGRTKNQRRALIKSLTRSLILKGRIKTTEAKAKELRPYVEKLITLGKKDTLASYRLLSARVGKEAARKIVSDVAKNYQSRRGGYTRIVKIGQRSSDASPMAIIEFVQS